MKIRKKPDILVVLTVFVGLGILFSSLSQGLLNTPSNTITKNNTAKLGSSMLVRTPTQGRFVNVSTNVSTMVTSPDKEAKQQEAFNELQPPTEYLP